MRHIHTYEGHLRLRTIATALIILLGAAVPLASAMPAAADSGTCPRTVFLGNHPSDALEWTDETQGVAHDAGHWFFTSNVWLLKIPVGVDLATEIDPEEPDEWPSGVDVRGIPDFLEDQGWNHFGDLDQVNGFLFVPMSGTDPGDLTNLNDDVPLSGIAVFNASNLGYLGMQPTVGGDATSWAGWNPADYSLYTSGSAVTLRRYSIDFSTLATDVSGAISFTEELPLNEAGGSGIDPWFANIQGGAFTPWGDFYLVNGYLDVDPSEDRGGVHLFHRDETDGKWKLAENSQNGSGDFNYEYLPVFGEWEEPEGADWWNREVGPSSPGISGQLHVMLNDNDVSEDDLWLKHYAVDYWCKAGFDSDGDGLSDIDEGYTLGTSPVNADTDIDGVNDGDELNVLGTNPLHPDSDHDGVLDGDEDSDGDALTDGDELNDFGTDPLDADTDDDGLTDGDEISLHHTDPVDADSDDDGLTDGAEVNVYGSDPLDADTDDDGLTDGDEINLYGTSPTDADTDDDELADGQEVDYGTNPVDADSDDDGLRDGEDVEFVQQAVNQLPVTAYKSIGTQNSLKFALEGVEALLIADRMDAALDGLSNVRGHVDGCGAAADNTDWIVSCSDQLIVRALLDQLVDNLTN